MITAGDFSLFSNRDHYTPTKKQHGIFVGSDVHCHKWQHSNSTRLDPISNRVFLNDYVYPDHDGKQKRKPRPNFFLGTARMKKKNIGFDMDGMETNESTAHLGSES
tara:strand:- start:720 stop:1037 length:318 start_codon:yes stop_codon:yes gene_type:complete